MFVYMEKTMTTPSELATKIDQQQAELKATPSLKEMVDAYKIGNTLYPSTLEADVFINRGNLQEEFMRHAERFAFWGTAHELAVDIVNRLSARLKRVYAELDAEKRQEFVLTATKSTEKMVENVVITDPRYIDAQEELFEAEKQAGLLKAARDAMMSRRDMLIQLGSTARAEYQADIAILSREAKDRRLDQY